VASRVSACTGHIWGTLTGAMAETTVPLAGDQFRLLIADRLVGVKPYILIGQLYLTVALLTTFGAVQGIFDVDLTYYVAIGLVGCTVTLVAPRDSLRHVFVSLPLLLLITYLICSIAWATGVMPYRAMFQQTVPIVVATVFVASILPFERIIQSLKVGFVVGILLSFYALVTDPESRIHRLDDSTVFSGWRASFQHKNGMVPFLVLASITFIIFEHRRWLKYFVVLSSIVLTVGSQSATGMASVIVVVSMAWWLNAYLKQDLRLSGSYIALSLFGAVLLGVVITVLLPWLVNLYGKDLTFTNRTDIWSASIGAIEESPWIGYGWNGVWIEYDVEPTVSLNREIGFVAGHAHDAVLEMLLEGGVVGLALYLSFFGSVGIAAWRALRTHVDIARWALLFLACQVVVGVSEVTLFHGWIFMLVLLRGVLGNQLSTTARAHL
jgi:exopolysaccharide production protein ExoQ